MNRNVYFAAKHLILKDAEKNYLCKLLGGAEKMSLVEQDHNNLNDLLIMSIMDSLNFQILIGI